LYQKKGKSMLTEQRPRNNNVKSFSELSKIAIQDLRKSGATAIVCGPITTGGRGNPGENVRAMNAVIIYLKTIGHLVFDQMPYESNLWWLQDRWQQQGNEGYCMPILEEFYLPIYRSGLILLSFFLPDWQTSFGASWERNKFEKLGIPIRDLDEETVDMILEIHG
jgi:hypothetical protein